MPPMILRDRADAPLDPLVGRTVCVVGFGNQGHAHALNLRDSGIRVVVANRRDSATGRHAESCGFEPLPTGDAVAQADLTIIALPDEVQPEVYEQSIAASLRKGSTVGFLHGFSLRYGLITPAKDVGVVMVAPKGPGLTLRQRYQAGQGIPCLLAVHQETPSGDAEAVALAWAAGIGCARAGVILTSIAQETETDLFGEQAVLCGGMTWLILAAFETLVAAGYDPEVAYLECCHEAKQVADLVYERGLAGMMQAISNTAEFGAHRAGPLLVDDALRTRMREVLQSVRDGSFARAFRDDAGAGSAWLNEQRRRLADHPIEPAGATIRALMPWLGRTPPDHSSSPVASPAGPARAPASHQEG